MKKEKPEPKGLDYYDREAKRIAEEFDALYQQAKEEGIYLSIRQKFDRGRLWYEHGITRG